MNSIDTAAMIIAESAVLRVAPNLPGRLNLYRDAVDAVNQELARAFAPTDWPGRLSLAGWAVLMDRVAARILSRQLNQQGEIVWD